MSEWERIGAVLSNAATHRAILAQLGQHLYLSAVPVAIATLIALPVGIVLTRVRRAAEWVMSLVGVLQTLPSLVLLALMIPLLGVGTLPAVTALLFYALLPILRNTYAGILHVDRAMIEAGRGMGMTAWQLLVRVEIPLALPVIMSGIRVATVMVIGWATLAAYIGAGGLGDLIVTGFATVSSGHVIAGGIPVTLLAILADTLLGRLERAVTPRGVSIE